MRKFLLALFNHNRSQSPGVQRGVADAIHDLKGVVDEKDAGAGDPGILGTDTK